MSPSLSAQVSRRALSKVALAGVGALVATTAASTSANAAASDIISVSATKRATDTQTLLNMINTYRVQNGLGKLAHSATIAAMEEAETRRQFAEGYFSHSTTFLTDPRVQGYSSAHEIISLSWQGRLQDLMDFWKSSPSHNAALLAPEANVCGIGFSYGSGNILPWKILGNVAIYRYEAGRGPQDITQSVSSSQVTTTAKTVDELPEIYGGILAKYNQDGGEAFYGKPLHAERDGALAGGRYQTFDKNGLRRTIFYSPFSGTHTMYEPGGIAHFWRSKGAETAFGYPLMEETGGLADGGYYQSFRKGSSTHRILWHADHGINVVYENGAIGQTWLRTGAERGAGYPLTGEYVSGIEMRQEFSNGITFAWDSFTGKVRTIKR